MILGIDEVGRGPWAGPLVVGAVVLPVDSSGLEGLTDSKKLSAKRRRELDIIIREKALGWGLGWVSAEELDKIGLSAALRLATVRAVEGVKTTYHEIVIDGTINFLKDTAKGKYVTTMAKADYLVPAVSAASIIAKVARDSYMEEQGVIYPEYGFGSHVGYGTAQHREALQAHGVTALHRKSFAPIAKLLTNASADTIPDGMLKHVTTKAIGDKAEGAVADWLVSKGFHIVERNWKTKQCEIDIIAQKERVTYFVEVKYRSSNKYGDGLAAITATKLRQMRFAAELYSKRKKLVKDLMLVAVSTNKEGEMTLIEIE